MTGPDLKTTLTTFVLIVVPSICFLASPYVLLLYPMLPSVCHMTYARDSAAYDMISISISITLTSVYVYDMIIRAVDLVSHTGYWQIIVTVLLLLTVLTSYFSTIFSDPGILPKNIEPTAG